MYDGSIKMIVHDERVVCDDWRPGVKGMENCTLSLKFCQSPEVFTTNLSRVLSERQELNLQNG